ncbi:MAG TPA: nitroreductase family protein [Verrucomicrobiota bacterium]|nr:nitroreductase family protein [Verrucomicrobiota bacterium]
MKDYLQPWSVNADDFPASGYASDQLEFLLNYAILAPSSHNTQPWLFRINAMDVELFADRRRALRVIDPSDRELTISCGAALYNLRMAAEYFGHKYEVSLFPNPEFPDLLARLRLGLSGETSSDDVLVFHAIAQRRTNRKAFRPDPVPTELLAELESLTQTEGAWLSAYAVEEVRNAVADLVAQADRMQWADKAFREELARWVRTKAESHSDGLPVHDLGIKDWMSFAGPALIRTFDRGGGQAARDREVATHSPVLAVLWTPEDNAPTWLNTGQALQSLLLHARSENLWASFLNQPIEIPELRAQLASMLGLAGYPQILLRLGYGEETPPSPRRTVRELLMMHKTAHH